MDSWIGEGWAPTIGIGFLMISWRFLAAKADHKIDEFREEDILFQDCWALLYERWLLDLHLRRFLLIFFINKLSLRDINTLLLEVSTFLSFIFSDESRRLSQPQGPSIHLHSKRILRNGLFIHHPIHSPHSGKEFFLNKYLIIIPLGHKFMTPAIEIIKLYELIKLFSLSITLSLSLSITWGHAFMTWSSESYSLEKLSIGSSRTDWSFVRANLANYLG